MFGVEAEGVGVESFNGGEGGVFGCVGDGGCQVGDVGGECGGPAEVGESCVDEGGWRGRELEGWVDRGGVRVGG